MVAATLMLSSLLVQLLLQVLCESIWFVTVRMIQGCEGVRDVPGIQGGSGGICKFCNRQLD